MSDNHDLSCSIEGDEIVIRIGIKTLETAVKGSPYGEDIEDFFVTDYRAFALEVVNALKEEDEEGTTPMHVMFDKAFEHVMENGGDGFWCEDIGGPRPTPASVAQEKPE